MKGGSKFLKNGKKLAKMEYLPENWQVRNTSKLLLAFQVWMKA